MCFDDKCWIIEKSVAGMVVDQVGSTCCRALIVAPQIVLSF